MLAFAVGSILSKGQNKKWHSYHFLLTFSPAPVITKLSDLSEAHKQIERLFPNVNITGKLFISDDAILYVADIPKLDKIIAIISSSLPNSLYWSQRLFVILNLYDWYLAARNPVQRWIGLTSRHPKWQELDSLHFLCFFCALFFKLIGSVCG